MDRAVVYPLQPVLVKLIKWNIALFALFSIILPPLWPKKVFFLLGVALAAAYIGLYGIRSRSLVINPFLILAMFTIYLFYGVFGSSDLALGIQFLNVCLSLFLIIIMCELRLDIERTLRRSGVVLAAIVIYMSIGYFGGFISLSLPGIDQMIAFYKRYDLGYLGVRDFGDFKPVMLHFISSPFLMIPLLLFFRRLISKVGAWDLLAFVTVGIAIAVSGSRGIVLFSLLGMLALYIKNSRVEKSVVVLSVLCAVALYLVIGAIDDLSQVFSPKETSNSIKIGHFRSFVSHVDAVTLTFGEGLAAFYFSSGVNDFRAQTELTLLDFVRYFGVFLTIILFLLLFFPMRADYSDGRFSVKLVHFWSNFDPLIIFSLYLLMSFTNPVLLNSFGIFSVLWYWSRTLGLTNNESSMHYSDLSSKSGEAGATAIGHRS